jgi:hypothetical protein
LGAAQLGADLSYSDILDQFQQTAQVGNPIESLPNVSTKLARLNGFGKYAVDKNSASASITYSTNTRPTIGPGRPGRSRTARP